MKKKRRDTPKKRLYIRERIRNPQQSKAKTALKAGYTPSTAYHQAARIEKSVEESLKNALLKVGVDNLLLARGIKDGLKAKKGKNPDHTNRRGYTELAIRVKGEIKEDGNPIAIMDAETLQALLAGMKKGKK